MTKVLYPEIIAAGSLTNALNKEFERIRSSLKVCIDDEDFDKFPLTYARVEKGKRFSQIYIAAEKKLYLPDYWRNGVCLANGQTDSLTLLAETLEYWLNSEVIAIDLAKKFNIITLNKKAKAFDENKEVEYTWHFILNDPSRSELHEFVALAIKDGIISSLFPYTSLNRLCFSRCTGYPYTNDAPIVIPVSDNKYEVRLGNEEVLGSGTAFEVLAIVKNNLPLNIKPAIQGTADDL